MRSQLRRHLGQFFEGTDTPAALEATIDKAAPAMMASASKAEERAAECPPEFSPHQYTIMLLHIAAEIEHALMVEYLYAAYSLGGSQVPDAQRPNVQCWQGIVLGIAKEEDRK